MPQDSVVEHPAAEESKEIKHALPEGPKVVFVNTFKSSELDKPEAMYHYL